MTGPDLRILIVSTPKTGSTWLRSLLSGIYRLPQLYLEPGFDCQALDRGGPRWVAQCHLQPYPELTEWIRQQGAVVVTAIRHPADVLISLYHHVREFRAASLDLDFVRRMLLADFERVNITTDSTGKPFWADLACSLDWMCQEGARVVRYEDLRSDPLGSLRELTSGICAVPDERIEASMEMSDFGLMRALAGPFGGFFREGRIGSWRDLLPPDVIEVFRSVPPYPAQMAALGYSMDPSDPMIARPVPFRPRHAMAALERFENGVPAAPILVQCFFWARSEQRTRWQEQLAGTGPGSFYRWLSLPSRRAPLTNLAEFIYTQRPDLQVAYPVLNGSGLHEYLQWFLHCAQAEYGLAPEFIDAQQVELRRWANEFAGEGLPLSNMAALVYGQRPDVQQAYPDLAGSGRYEYVQWFLRNSEPEFADPQRAALVDWANQPSTPDGLPVSNMAALVYDQRPDVRLAYPDLAGRDRHAYVQWFLGNTEPEYAGPQRAALSRWAAEPSTPDGLPVLNMAAYVYQQRADLRDAYPDLTGRDRYPYVQWFLRNAEPEHADAQRAALLPWANAFPACEGLPLSNLALHLHAHRADLQRAFPDLAGGNRYPYVQWFLRNAEPEFADAQRAALLPWANAFPAREGLPLSNLALHLHAHRADLQRAFPDLAGSHRYPYVQWFLRNADPEFADAQRAALLPWANAIQTREGLPISNLALHLHAHRADLQRAYPDLAGSDLYPYVQWFLRNLEPEFADAQRAVLLPWANAFRMREGLPLSNLAAHLHAHRADLRRAYPDLAGGDRYPYVQWFLGNVEPEYADAQLAAVLPWASQICPRPGAGIYAGLPLLNVAAAVYDQRPDVRQAYPDLTGSDRYEFVQWFLGYADPEYAHRQRAGLMHWANAISYIDGATPAMNFVLHICRTRTDVQGSFPTIQGEDRRRLIRAVIAAAKALEMDADYIEPLERSLGRHWLPEVIRVRLPRWLSRRLFRYEGLQSTIEFVVG